VLTAFALICALSISRTDCNYASATRVFQVPEKAAQPGDPPEPSIANPVACILRAQQWTAANVSFDGSKEWVKVFCVPPHKLPGNVG
jgi:hypothetical protein